MRHIVWAALLTGCVPGEGALVSFIEDFTDTRWMDDDATDAWVDLDEGLVRGEVWEFGDPGDGSDSALVTTKKTKLSPGEYQFESVALTHPVTVDGDLTLRVAGPVVSSGMGTLEVIGSLTLIAEGAVEIAASMHARGDFVMEQPSDAGIVLDEGARVGTRQGGKGTPGSVSVSTRGALSVINSAALETGAPTDKDATNHLTVRAGGDVTIANTAYVRTEAWLGLAGRTRIYTEASLLMEERSFLGAREDGASLEIRAGGDVRLTGSCFAEAGAGGSIDLQANGDVSLDNRSFLTCDSGIDGPCDVSIAARQLELTARSWLEAGGSALDRGGDLSIEVADDISVTGSSWAVAGDGHCVDAGFFQVRAGGDITVLDQSYLRAARSQSNDEEDYCADSTESQLDGDLSIEAGGTFTDDKTAGVYDQNGASTGNVSIVEGADVHVMLPRSVGPSSWVQSLPVALDESPSTVLDASTIALSAARQAVLVAVSPDGSEAGFMGLEDLVGVELEDGWRYRVELRSGLFDGPTLDRIQIDHQANP